MPLLFFLFPIFGLYNGIKYFIQYKYRYGLLFFFFWFGYSVNFYPSDIINYRDDYALLVRYTWENLYHLIVYFNDDALKFSQVAPNVYNYKPDFFALTLGFLVSRFTENPRWFFAIISVIYFYFMIKFLDEALKYTGYNKSKGWSLFFATLVLIVPFFVGITGVRFWTGLFFYIWILLKYVNTGQRKYLFLTAFSIFFHYTFIFPVIISFMGGLLKINKTVFKALTVIGIVYVLLSTTTSSLNFIRNALDIFDSDTLSKATASYLDEEEIVKGKSNLQANTNWYVTWRVTLLNFYFITFFVFDFFKFNKWDKPKTNLLFENLYQIFFVIALFTFNLSSIGRFVYIFYFLVIIRIISFQVYDSTNKLQVWNMVFLPIFIIHVLVSFRVGLYFVDPLLVISPSIALLFIHSNIGLSEFLVGH